jgi:hypothetical protein
MTAAAETFRYLQPTFRRDQVEEMTRALDEDGFALIPGVLNAAEVAEARREIDRLRPFHFDNINDPLKDHYKCVFNRAPYWLRYLDEPGVIDLAERAMGEECHIIGMTAWRSRPEGPDGTSGPNPHAIHTDHQLFTIDEQLLRARTVRMPMLIATAHYYLDDIDVDLAPTWVLPGSHLNGRYAHTVPPEQRLRWAGREIQPVVCKAGDVLFFRSEIWHSGSRNRTVDRTRYLVQVHYSHRYIAHKFSPYLTFQFNPEVLACATPRQRRLLGEHRKSNYD